MNTMQKQAARKFVECWTFRRGSEKGEDQQFWNSLLGEVLGMEDVASRVQYQVPVPKKGTTKFLDAWIPETRVLIEHKSRGIKLDAPQSGHGGKTPRYSWRNHVSPQGTFVGYNGKVYWFNLSKQEVSINEAGQ